MHSKHHNMPGHSSPSHKTGQRQHHAGHAHGHPTEHGNKIVPENRVGGPDYGSMEEHGLSEGNVRAVTKALPENQCNNSILEEHGLQHVDYGELTGHNYNSASYPSTSHGDSD